MGLAALLLGEQNPFAQWASQNSGALGALGAGMASGPDLATGLGTGLRYMPQAKQDDLLRAEKQKAEALRVSQSNATRAWLEQNRPDLLPGLEMGLSPADLWSQAMQPKAGAEQKNPFMSAGDGTFFNWQTGQFVSNPNAQPDMPPPPSGYRWTPDGRMEAVPGGPAWTDPSAVDPKASAAAGRRDVATQTITTAASTARKLAENQFNVGLAGAAAGFNPQTDAAELRRQVDVLKSTASIENLTAMRQASPTGGALGAVSDRENAMLAAASGAIDPNAGPEAFNRALDNYELTLLQIVHGPQAGLKIFQETRGSGGYAAGSGGPAGNQTSTGVQWSVEP